LNNTIIIYNTTARWKRVCVPDPDPYHIVESGKAAA